MADRGQLLQRTRVMLAKAGFAISEQVDVAPITFDLVARRDDRLLLLKVLGNVDALSERVASELRSLAGMLRATPILIGERSGGGALEDGVAYSHRDVPVMTLPTLQEFLLDNTPPMAYASPGGIHVQLRGALLRRLREERALTLSMLAEVAGVSRRAIQMYEEGMRATIDAALRLEEFLQESIVEPIDPFSLFRRGEPAASPGPSLVALEEEVFRMLRSKGFDVVPTRSSPFDGIATQESRTILTGVDSEQDPASARRAQLISSVSRVAEKDGMIVVRHEMTVTNLRGTPLVRKKELEKLRDPQELRDLLDERRRQRSAPE